MRFKKGYWLIIAFAAAVIGGTLIIAACEEDVADLTRPQVQYNDQTFALLVCDGNGNTPWSWGHDGAPVCTLDWNSDGSGTNRVPVTYVYDRYPIVDGAVTKNEATVEGDKIIWDKTPWTTIKVNPVYGGGSGVKEVKVKAVYTYVNPPRIWFLFQWEDPSKTIRGSTMNGNAVKAGTFQYYWHQKPGSSPPGDGFSNGRQYDSREDWLGLVWSTYFIWNTADKGKEDKENHHPANLAGYDWQCVPTVPNFQTQGLNAITGTGNKVYQAPDVSTSDPNSPYYDKYYPGAFCDFWFFSASRTNYTVAGGWDTLDAAFLFDLVIDRDGFTKPPTGSITNLESLTENFKFDSGISGYTTNGDFAGYPFFMSTADPSDNPPGATYLWSAELTAPLFSGSANWPAGGGAAVAGYLHRPALGSCADVFGRCSWWDPTEINYQPWDGDPESGSSASDPDHYFPNRPKNEIKKQWNYTVEIEREIGTLAKNNPEEDCMLGIFNPHPDE